MLRWAPYPFSYTSFLLASLAPGTLSYQTYILATIFSLPKAIIFVWLGSRLETINLYYILVGVALGIGLTYIIVIKVRKQIALYSEEEGVHNLDSSTDLTQSEHNARSRQTSTATSPTINPIILNNVGNILPR